MSRKNLNIYQYTDHQKYLLDWMSSEKDRGIPVSLRYISDRLGLKSRSYFQRVLHDSDRPLSDDVLEKLLPLLKLTKSEAEYFRALVRFAHAETLQAKNDEYEKMHRLLHARQSGHLDAARFEYLSSWWLPALREVATFKDWKGNYREMGSVFEPALSESQTRKGVELMLKLGILVQEDSQFNQTERFLDTGHDLRSLAIAKYHQSILSLAHDAIESQALDDREIGAITFGFPRSAFPKLRSRIREMQQEFVKELCGESAQADTVYQFGIQLFPLTGRSRV